MAPVFRHGRETAVLINDRSFKSFLRGVTVSASMDPADTTTFDTQYWKTYIPGQRDVTMSAEGLFAASTVTADDIANFFDSAIGSTSQVIITVGPGGDSTGRRAILLDVDATQYDIGMPVSDLVSLNVNFQGSNGYQSGRWLRPLSTAASTESNSAVDSGLTNGGSTGGGVGHFHVTEASTISSLTMKIQHSTSGSTWSDLIAFSNVTSTAATFQRSTVSGTVKEQLRASISAFTGGASKSAKCAVAFARYGSNKL